MYVLVMYHSESAPYLISASMGTPAPEPHVKETATIYYPHRLPPEAIICTPLQDTLDPQRALTLVKKAFEYVGLVTSRHDMRAYRHSKLI